MKPNEELLHKIGTVRKRWKAFLWARGLAWVLGVLVISLVIGLALANSTDIPTWTVTGLRLGMVVLFAFTLIKALILPLRRLPDDTQLARFVEEKNPGLEDRLVSAVDALKKARPEQGVFAHLLVKDALDRTRTVRFNDQINKRKFGTFAALAAMFAVALVVSLYISSLFFPVGSVRLLAGLIRPPADDIFDLKVTPGNVTVPRGSDVVVQVTTGGFDPRKAEIYVRYQNSSQWEISTMEVSPQNLPTFRELLFNLQEPLTYFIDADGHRTKEFNIRVEDLPRVEKMDYTYNYPAYTGLVPNKQEGATDMVALRGTQVDVVVHGSQLLSGGAIVFSDGKSVPLQPSAEREVTGKVTIDRNATFRIKLVNTGKQEYTGLEEYSMEALDDEKPIVEFTKPGRDENATSVQEVFTELRANDDFGINKLELHFNVNGGQEQTVELFQNKGAAPKEISGSHTFFLEEYKMQPGDFVTYYGKAVDTRNPANSVQTDMYFIQIRPFGKEYTQGQQGGGGGGGGGGGQQDDPTQLSKRQKDIIVATDRLRRDKDQFKPKEWTDNFHALSANETKLIEQTDTLLGRLSRRGLTGQNKQFEALADNLKKAIEQMTPAAEQLQKSDPDAAMPPEQKALQFLMRAEALFTEIQVTMGGGGGGGGGGGQSAQDLADLFELELDQSKNQYETVQRGEMQRNTQEVDEALKKLQELAQRQQKMMEQRAMQGQGGGGSSSDQMNAQDIQRETEKLARQLEKLSRENNDRQMSDVSKALQQAAQNMQRQAQGGNAQAQQQAAQQALDAMKRAQQMLQNSQGGNTQQQLAQAHDQAKRLQQQQAQVSSQTRQFAEESGPNAQERKQQIGAQQESIAEQAQQLQQNLEAASNSAQDRQGASAARSAANQMRSSQLVNKMNNAAQLIQQGFPEYANQQQTGQNGIEKGLADLEKQLSQAANAAGNSDEQKTQNALNKTSDAVRNLQSFQTRQQQGQQGQQGQQQGQQGQGQQGQQQGQQGQGQGQQAQQGQGQQGQGQQGQGGRQGQQGGQQAQGGGGGRQNGQPNGYGNPNGGAYQGGNGIPPAGGVVDYRQIQRELQQRIQDIQDIKNTLGSNDPAARELDQAANALRILSQGRFSGNPQELDKLAQEVIDPLRNLELELSRRLQIMIGKDNVRSAQEDDMPAGWQKYIEDYYKRLAATKPQP
jgi:Domain of unknown function (DUF4175)